MQEPRDMVTPPNGTSPDPNNGAQPGENVMRTRYRELTADDQRDMGEVKRLGAEFYNYVNALGANREISLAKTKVEEAVMWAVKSITG